MTRVLVTGADGQLGRRLVRQLLARGYEVRGTVLPPRIDAGPSRRRAWTRVLRSLTAAGRRAMSSPAPRHDVLEAIGAEAVTGDLTEPEFARLAVADVDAVVHTANFVRSDAFENNVRATFNVTNACAARADHLHRFVYISSSAVYPNDPDLRACAYHPVDERHPVRPIGAYPASKLTGEKIVEALARESGLPATILRPSYMVSGDAVLNLWTVSTVCSILQRGLGHPESELYAPAAGEPWNDLRARAASGNEPCAVTDSDGRPWVCQPVDARDVAHAAICALDSRAAVGDTFNVSAPDPLPYPEAAAMLARLTGQEAVAYRTHARWIYDLDSSRAQDRIGYAPAWGVPRMIEDALAVRRGESDGLT
jgi:nucleoside-diphosphate-sugar epimerase